MTWHLVAAWRDPPSASAPARAYRLHFAVAALGWRILETELPGYAAYRRRVGRLVLGPGRGKS